MYDDELSQELSYDTTREALRNLTMPPVPNFDIPPSPPGSPLPKSTKKFANFLKLKKQGTHFNERLSKTPALKNPMLFQKLRQHAGVSDEEQYATTLSEELAVPTSYPPFKQRSADVINDSQNTSTSTPDPSMLRVERILTLLRDMDDKAKTVFFKLQSDQKFFAKCLDSFLKLSEELNASSADETLGSWDVYKMQDLILSCLLEFEQLPDGFR